MTMPVDPVLRNLGPDGLSEGLADRYRLIGELGSGGMATVFLAEDLRHSREVALKVLHPDLSYAIGTERFQREIRLTAGLQDPHLVTVYDSGETAGHLWFTMPRIDGESLRARLLRERQFSIPEAARITIQAARAVAAAHRAGVVHRDLKPENLLLGRDGQVYVTDFGVARQTDSAKLTRSGLAVGTPAYMSPEQSTGATDLDARSDVYALGCVLYEMLAGEPPYVAATAQGLSAKHLHAPIPDVRIVRPTVSLALHQVLTATLAKSAADRPASGAELADSVQAALSSESRHRRWSSFGLVVPAVGLAIAVLLFLVRSTTAGRSAVETDSSRPLKVAIPFFRARTADPASVKLAEGLTEYLTQLMAQSKALNVVPVRVMRTVRDQNLGTDSLTALLGATLVVKGELALVGGTVEVRAEVEESDSGPWPIPPNLPTPWGRK